MAPVHIQEKPTTKLLKLGTNILSLSTWLDLFCTTAHISQRGAWAAPLQLARTYVYHWVALLSNYDVHHAGCMEPQSPRKQVLGDNLRTVSEFHATKTPPQGGTHITEGRSAAMEIIERSETREADSDCGRAHHVLVLLTDGAHTVGPKPETRLPIIRSELRANVSMLRLSVVVVGVTRSSDSSLRMLMKQSLETVAWVLSQRRRLDRMEEDEKLVFKFGKYQGESYEEVTMESLDHFFWGIAERKPSKCLEHYS